jgi:hypothetical protein
MYLSATPKEGSTMALRDFSEAFTNARGGLCRSPKIDPGVRYPPYSENQIQRMVVNKLMP